MLSFGKGVCVPFFLSIIILECVDSSGRRGLQNIGASCYPRDSCRASLTEESKTCECDVACHRRGTCCIDSLYVDSQVSRTQEICAGEMIFGVHHYFSFVYPSGRKTHSFFQIAKCNSNWSGSVKVKQLCEVERSIDGADIMTAIPTTSFSSGISYKNYYCALCNNDIEHSILWDFSIFKDETDISKRFVVLPSSEAYVGTWDSIIGTTTFSNEKSLGLVYNKVREVYGYWDSELNFYPVTVTLSIPEQVKHHVKGCQPELISCCSPDWTDIPVKVLCESYYGIIKEYNRVDDYDEYHDRYFRNAHCALCNNVTNFQGYSCESFDASLVSMPSYQSSTIVRFDHLLLHSKCLADQENSAQGLSCRSGVCVNPLHQAKNGECTV